MVDDFTLVNKFKTIIKNIVDEKKSLYVFALFKMDDLIDKWTVVLSAPWAEEESNRDQSFYYLTDILRKSLNVEEQVRIARVGVLGSTNHFITELTRTFKVTNGPLILKDTKINGNIIHEAFIFYCLAPEDNPKKWE